MTYDLYGLFYDSARLLRHALPAPARRQLLTMVKLFTISFVPDPTVYRKKIPCINSCHHKAKGLY